MGTVGGRAAPREAGRRHRAVLRHLPGAPHPAGVPGLAPVHLVLEHLLRDDPLRDAGHRARRDVPQDAGALRPVAQRAAVHARVRAHRVLALPADATAAHAAALRLRRHRGASSSTSGRSSASRSTRTASRPRRRARRSATSTRRCRACTSAGPRGRRSRCCRSCGAGGSRSWCASTRSRRSSRSSSPATTGSSTRSAAGSCSRRLRRVGAARTGHGRSASAVIVPGRGT